ncbi:MAG: hypothetical protein F4Z72_14785 [Gemmatimonadales bacterium]|nr:hypothetical protein [Candidatus Palauibacter irciniicola]MYC18595.1 hypothetical protein [Gemmatimonadales bacterium]
MDGGARPAGTQRTGGRGHGGSGGRRAGDDGDRPRHRAGAEPAAQRGRRAPGGTGRRQFRRSDPPRAAPPPGLTA